MGVDSEPKGKLQTTMTITTNSFENRTMDGGDLSGGEARKSNGEDLGAGVSEHMNPRNHDKPIVAENGDETEYSSSFGDTLSSNENGSMINDGEVESPFFFDNALMSDYDDFGGSSQPGKKKLTDHWRKFIHPIMWRCKWLELQIKEIESRAQDYDRQIIELDQKNEFDNGVTSSGLKAAESLSLSNQKQTSEVMMRRKRKRVEHTTNTSAYMSNHNVFSYHEERKLVAEPPTVINKYNGKFDIRTTNGNDEFQLDNELSALELTDTDSSLVHILCKIDEMQSQARSLKSRVDKVVSENPTKFSSINRLNLLMAPAEAFTSYDINPTSPNGENRMLVGSPMYNSLEHVSDDNEDLFMPENSSHGVSMQIPDRIVTADLPEPGSLCETNGDVFLIHKSATKEELHNFERVLSQVTERPQILMENPKIISPMTAVKSESLSDVISESDKDTPSTSRPNVANKKRKRRPSRKAGGDSWKLKLGSR